MSTFISVHASRKQGKINEASVFMKLPHPLAPDAALIARVAEGGERIVTADGG